MEWKFVNTSSTGKRENDNPAIENIGTTRRNSSPKSVLKASFSFGNNTLIGVREGEKSGDSNNNNNNSNNSDNILDNYGEANDSENKWTPIRKRAATIGQETNNNEDNNKEEKINNNNLNRDNEDNTSGNRKATNKEETSKENTLINSNNNENSWKSPNPLHTSLLMKENRLSSSGITMEDIRVSDEEWKEYLKNSHEENKAAEERKIWKEKVAADHKEKIRIQREKQFQNARNEIFANKENLPTFKSAFIPKTKMMKSKEGWILPPLDNLFSPSSISQSAYLVPPAKEVQHLYCSNKINNDNFIRLSTAKDISVKEIVEIQQNPIVYNQLTEADSLCSSQFLTASVRAPRLIEKKFNEIADNLPSPDSSLTQSTVLKRELYIGNLRV